MTAGGEAPRKIAILGGGIAALATAFELTRDPNWRDRFESVTIYQMGWRLGGKCASSRDRLFGRIEEHGIHGFLGSYYNALPMMVDCYAELNRPDGAPLATFDEALVPQDFGMLWELLGRKVAPWPQEFPTNLRHPSQGPETRRAFELCMAGVSETVITMLVLLAPGGRHLKRRLQGRIERWAAGLGRRLARPGAHPGIARLHRTWRWLKPAAHAVAQIATGWRRQFALIDHLTTLVCGAFADGVHERGFDHLDEENFSDFLRRHGAHEDTLRSPFNLNFINMTYQYPGGDTSKPAWMAAGCYLHWALLSSSYMGSFIWRFAAGSGEVLIAPLYEVLRRRGVRFEFFHKVRRLSLSADQSQVASVTFDVQAHLRPGLSVYEPLIEVKGLPCWPDRPRYGQLVEGREMARGHELTGGGHDLESYWTNWRPRGRRRLAQGRDFDTLVFAISIGAIPHLCADLLKASPAWRDMVREIKAYPTMAMQIWLTQSAEDLGWDVPRRPGDAIFSTTWINPQNGHAEFADLIRYENWDPQNQPKGLWYFCGLFVDDFNPSGFGDHTYPARQKARVKYQSIQYLQSTMGMLLPKASTNTQHPPGDAFGFDFELLHDGYPQPRSGMNRFDSQFWRANIDPSERYVTSPPGSTKHRLKAGESGFGNLILAGDWIYTGLNVGSVEGTVMSGRLAANAVCGAPPLSDIVGYRN